MAVSQWLNQWLQFLYISDIAYLSYLWQRGYPLGIFMFYKSTLCNNILFAVLEKYCHPKAKWMGSNAAHRRGCRKSSHTFKLFFSLNAKSAATTSHYQFLSVLVGLQMARWNVKGWFCYSGGWSLLWMGLPRQMKWRRVVAFRFLLGLSCVF